MRHWILISLLALAGCDPDAASFFYPDNSDNDVVYTYPYDGQRQVSPYAPVVVQLSDPLAVYDVAGADEVSRQALLDALVADLESQVVFRRDDDVDVTFSAQALVADRNSDTWVINTFVLTPQAPLDPAAAYYLELDGVQTPKGGVSLVTAPLEFSTRGDLDGPRALTDSSDVFDIQRMIPDGDTQPFMDFSTLRLQFTQPLDRDSVSYGAGIGLYDEADVLVPATVMVKANRLSIDPVDDLQAGTDYELRIDADSVYNRNGEALAAVSETWTAGNSRPREILVQEGAASAADPLDQCDADAPGVILSPLTGSPINCVPVNALLLGDDSVSQTSGDVHAELAFVPNYPEVSPLRVDRGSLLSGSSVSVRVAGNVPILVDTDDDGTPDTPLETGDISVRFISDANGFLLPNAYSQKEDAPRHVLLYLDVAMNADTAEANGALSQDILHVEVVGTAIVQNGRLVIEAIGVVEPEVLGLEQAWGVLSFHLESYKDQPNAPAPVVDATLPSVQSWMPDTEADRLRPGQPIIVNFNEPVARESLAQPGAVTLEKDGAAEPFSWRLDGSSLVITPDAGLQFSSEGSTTSYTVSLTSAVTDLAGNMLDQDYDLSFDMPVYVGSGDRAPIAMVTYPGYPCAFDAGTWDLANDDHGRCRYGESGDDNLPVMPMPADRSIRMQFSQSMRADSFVLGQNCGEGTFRVEQVNDSGGCIAPVPGRLDVADRSIVFTPDEPWQDGVLYGYRVMSKTDITPADCGVTSVCSSFDYPLQTAVLDGRDADRGGPDMRLFFRGAAPVEHVFQTLDNLPTLDTNSNYLHEDAEPDAQPDPDNAGDYLTPPNGTRLAFEAPGGLLLDANLGCGFVGRDPGDVFLGANPDKQVCNDKKFIHLTGALNADVVGWNESEGAVEVKVYPTVLMTTSLDTYAVLFLLVAKEIKLIPTGPQIMRIRYQDDGLGNRTEPVTGWIRNTVDGPVLEIDLDVYLDAPDLEPEALGLTLTHDLYSYPLSLSLSGPVTLLPDGRMRIEQVNVAAPDNIDVNISLIGIGAASMSLSIPQGGVRLDYISKPVKD
ncbi:MAG: Ig-like domain-containing protein [Alcanivoracaceae bacterium]